MGNEQGELISMRRAILFLIACMTLWAVHAQNLRRPGTLERWGWKEGDSIVRVPAAVKQIPPYTFAGVEGLRRVVFEQPSSLLKICEFAFAECIDLEEIELPDGLLAIEEGAFRECRSLRKLVIPSGIWRLPKELCHRCVSLESVEIPPQLREIEAFAFAGCESLREIHLGENLRKIGNNAFSRCLLLREVEMGEMITQLESYAFSDCRNLRRVVMPANWETLGELILSGCDALEEIVEGAQRPPYFECESFLLEPTATAVYERCRLVVPERALELYSRYHGWDLFHHLEVKEE